MDEKPIEEMTFEECLAKLNDLVDQLENGKLDLDRSIAIYAEAVRYRDRCRSILEDGERKVQELMRTAEGTKKEEFII
ncbi:MAG: exodeoxyribonuclease VII small subunit [Candidatus Methanomethylophilaceae archaeon]